MASITTQQTPAISIFQLAGKLEKFNYGNLEKHKNAKKLTQVLRSELERA